MLTFHTANAAFGNDGRSIAEETARILRETANRLDHGQTGGHVRDANGNTIGEFRLS